MQECTSHPEHDGPWPRLESKAFITLGFSPCQIISGACFIQPHYAVPLLERHIQLCLRSVLQPIRSSFDDACDLLLLASDWRFGRNT